MRKLTLATLIASLVGAQAIAQTASPRMMTVNNYEIGGSLLPGSPTSTDSMNIFSLGAEWEANMQCGNFDPKVSVSNQLNGVTDGFKSMMGNIVNNATSAVASLPALVIQRANPGLYDLLQQGVLQGKLDMEFAETSCEGIQDMIMGETGLPWEQATVATRQQTWADKISLSGGDAVAAKDSYDGTNIGDEGREWVCGEKRGGIGQPKVNTIYDVVVAGYNLYHDKTDLCSNGSPAAGLQDDSMIYKYWTSADAAADWVVQTVGEVRLDTCSSCRKIETQPGVSLEVKHADLAEVMIERLSNLVDGTTQTTWQNLNRVSAPPAVVITPSVIRKIQSAPDGGAERMIEDIGREVAFARLTEQARLAIRMLRTGAKEPNVQSFPNAPETIDAAVNELRENMALIQEAATKVAPVASKTVQSIMVGEEKRLQRARTLDRATRDNNELRLQE